MLLRLALFLGRSYWLILLSALLWLILSANAGWFFYSGLLIVLLVWQRSYPLSFPPLAWRYLGAVLITFFRQLWCGGVDVARRACFDSQLSQAGFARYVCRLTQPAQQQCLATLVSLLPGTCTVSILPINHSQQVLLLLHVLDKTAYWHAEVAELEWQLARFMASPLAKEREV